MILKEIQISFFRNIEEAKLGLSDGLNYFKGRNSQGKSNFLEAAYCLSLGRSYRTGLEEEVLAPGSSFARVCGIFSDGGADYSLEVVWEKTSAALKKVIKYNGKVISKLAEFINKAPMVLLAAQDINLITGSPDERRKFLDLFCCRIFPGHIMLLREYRKVMEQRNKWLKMPRNSRDKDLGEVLSEKLCSAGAEILMHRFYILEALKPEMEKLYADILNIPAPDLRYRGSVKEIKEKNIEGIRKAFMKTLQSLHYRESMRAFTLAGPHRDDFDLKAGGFSMKSFASMGELRSASIILKMAMASIIAGKIGIAPIILIDDSFNEFDPPRARLFLNYLVKSGQVLYSLTDITPYKNFTESAAEFTVEKGKITPCNPSA